MSKLISVIIPLYNAERFIKRALDSLIVQSYTNFEIIIINDGSTDKSVEICRSYKDKDERINIFSQNNAGVGAARNYGMKMARGELIFFLDSDDYILKYALRMLHDGYEESGKKMVVGGAFRQTPEGTICNQDSPTNLGILPFYDKQTLLNKNEITDCVWKYLQFKNVYLVSHCWGRMYETNI